MKRFRFILFLLVWFLLTLSNVSSHAYEDISSIRGITNLQVKVIGMVQEIEDEGLTAQQFRADAESKLRAAGIKVIPEDENHIPADGAFLFIYPDILKLKSPVEGYAYKNTIYLSQFVYIPRIDAHYIVSTWSHGYLGVTPDLHMIRENMKDRIDTFIKNYLTANPRQ
jgi:hypothetical protein